MTLAIGWPILLYFTMRKTKKIQDLGAMQSLVDIILKKILSKQSSGNV